MSLVQDIFRQSHSSILVTIHQKANLTRAILKKFLETADDGVVGLAPGYGPNCVLSVLAVATSTTVLLVQFTKLNGKKRKKGKNGATQANELDLLEELIFCADSCSKFAFQMDILATSLYFDYGLRIRGAVDLLATGTGKDERHSLAAMMNALGGEGTLNKLRVGTVFSDEKFGKTSRLEDVSLRAWCAWRAATLTNAAQRLNAAPRISTQDLDETVSRVETPYPSSELKKKPHSDYLCWPRWFATHVALKL
jgi:regulator of nonsense transcripts 1